MHESLIVVVIVGGLVMSALRSRHRGLDFWSAIR